MLLDYLLERHLSSLLLSRLCHALHLLIVCVVVPFEPLYHDLTRQAHFLCSEYDAYGILLLLLVTVRFVFD